MDNNETINSYDISYNVSNIDDLKEAVSLNGNEQILIQAPGSESLKISVQVLINEIVRLMRENTLHIEEIDPTVPEYVKNISSDQISNWNSIDQVKKDIKDLQTPHIKIPSFICEPASSELGNIINGVTLKWQTNNKPITRITINGNNIDSTLDQYTINQLFDNTTEFTLEITDDGGGVAISTVTLEFLNGVYHGSSVTTPITSDFIKSLDKDISNTNKIGFTTLSREDEYIYFACPKRLGSCAFTIGNEYDADFEFVEEFALQNENNYVELYYVYKSVNVHLGQTQIIIV